MSLDLVCASCSGLVELGRCGSCRAARERLRTQRQLPAGVLLAAGALLGVVALLARFV